MTVLLFARLADVAGSRVELPLAQRASVAALKQELARRYPELAGLLAVSRVAIGHDFVSDDTVIPDGVEVAIIPPVSGG